jgi:hypothetical protein
MVTVAGARYTDVLIGGLVLTVAASVCFIQAFLRGGIVARFFSVLFLLPTIAFIAFAIYEGFARHRERQHVIRRYNEFRGIVAQGEANRIMQFVAPEFHPWAAQRLHMYQLANSIVRSGTVSIFFGEAIVRPRTERKLLILPGGNSVKMVKREGEWFLGPFYID